MMMSVTTSALPAGSMASFFHDQPDQRRDRDRQHDCDGDGTPGFREEDRRHAAQHDELALRECMRSTALGNGLIYNASGVIISRRASSSCWAAWRRSSSPKPGCRSPSQSAGVAIAALVGLVVEKLAIEPAGNAEVVTLIIITIARR